MGERALDAEGTVSTKAQGPELGEGGEVFHCRNFFGLRTEKGGGTEMFSVSMYLLPFCISTPC